MAPSTTTTTSILAILEREEVAPHTTSTTIIPPTAILDTAEEELLNVTQTAISTSITTIAPTTEEEALSSTSATIIARIIEEVVLSSSITISILTPALLPLTEPEVQLPVVEVVCLIPEDWEFGAFDDEPETEWFWDYLSERTESSTSPTEITTITTVAPLEDTSNITLTIILAPVEIESIPDNALDSFAVIGGEREEEEEEDSSRAPRGEGSCRCRRRERSSIRVSSSSSPRRRRRRISGTTTPTSPTSARLGGTTDVEEAQDVFPSHVNLAANTPAYVRESDDFLLLSRWTAQLPQSGRSFYEQALRSTVRPDAIAGGTVGVCFGNGDVDIGPISLETGGAPRNWDADIERLAGERSSTIN